jgi:hypothetical protein
MTKFLKLISGLALTAVLAACGGGGGSAGTTVPSTGSGSTGTTDTATTAADLIFDLGGKTSITNTGSDFATLTVTVLNASRNVIADVPVTVALSPDGVFQTTATKTNSTGQFVGVIGIGGSKANRTLSATITAGGLTRVATVEVKGSQITVTPVPATPAPGQLVTLNIASLDSAGSAIPTATLTLGGSAGLTGTVVTDASGIRTTSFYAPAATGSYTVLVSGLGVSVTKVIEVVTAGATGKPSASGVVAAASLTPVPTTIAPNTDGGATNRSKLQAKFQTATNTGIENMRVRFEIVGNPLGNGESISTGTATVYTDAAGLAEAYYISGTRTSPTNGVSLRACYSSVDFTSSTDCPNSVTANLTVAGSPLSISITDDNKLAKGLGEIAYIKKFLIQVNDSSGVAVADAVVSASVDITHYGKGETFGLPYMGLGVVPPTIRDVHPDYFPPGYTVSQSSTTTTLVASTVVPTAAQNVWCLNEDFNRNGFRDVVAIGEDMNGDGVLQPRKAEIIVSYVNGNKTDASGQLLIQVSYGQSMAGWLAYTLRATTGVAGSEGDASKSYITTASEDDAQNGSFLTPPFGAKTCRYAN